MHAFVAHIGTNWSVIHVARMNEWSVVMSMSIGVLMKKNNEILLSSNMHAVKCVTIIAAHAFPVHVFLLHTATATALTALTKFAETSV